MAADDCSGGVVVTAQGERSKEKLSGLFTLFKREKRIY